MSELSEELKESGNEDLKLRQTIREPGSGIIYAACLHGMQDEAWYKEVSEAVRKGHNVQTELDAGPIGSK